MNRKSASNFEGQETKICRPASNYLMLTSISLDSNVHLIAPDFHIGRSGLIFLTREAMNSTLEDTKTGFTKAFLYVDMLHAYLSCLKNVLKILFY